jgi:3-oxoacyl-[acyl-carrier-protein] synthase II
MRKVVVTGLGVVSPLGVGVEKNWDSILNSTSGVDYIKAISTEALDIKIAGEATDFVIDDWVPKKEQKKTGRFIHLALASAKQAIESSGLDFEKEEGLKEKTGTLIGVGIGSLRIIEENAARLHNEAKRLSPFFIPAVIANSASGQVSIKWGLKGPNFSTVSACASGAHAIGESSRWIREGICDVSISGGAESVISPLAFQGFHAMRALSTRNEEPQKASRPWDKDRDGFILSEGSAVLILEEEQRAKKRKARIYAEVVGYGASSDAHHIAAPEPGGRGASLAMQQALASAKLSKEEINYINAHGTSTPAGDIAEAKAISSVFKEHSQKLWVSSTKSMTGHTLGAAGAIESIYSILSLCHQVAPPTINLDNPDNEYSLDFVPHKAREGKLNVVLNNSFGFGGTNACLLFKKYS